MMSSADSTAAAQSVPLLSPDDDHNRRLQQHVHPAGWVQPQPPAVYDLVVIGAHREQGWQRFLLDDLAQKILAHIDRPVLVVR